MAGIIHSAIAPTTPQIPSSPLLPLPFATDAIAIAIEPMRVAIDYLEVSV
jgi:hypothetical protein